MGLSYARPLTAVAEAIAIIRALLRGDTMTFGGKLFSVDRVKLDYAPRPDIAIFMAGRGDASLRLCGEIADGLLLSNMCTWQFAARAVAALRVSADAASRTGALGVVQYMPCCVAPDRGTAFRAARCAVAEMLPSYWALGARLAAAKTALVEGSGIGEEELAVAAQRLQAGQDPDAVLDDRYVTAYTIAGTAVDCRAQLAACAAAGITEVALTFSGPDAVEEMKCLADAMRLGTVPCAPMARDAS
jgi:5,10-methylenetetrahydromethanopterin reductase